MRRPLALVTGPTAGIGAVTAVELAVRGFDPILAARDKSRAAAIVESIRTKAPAASPRIVELDLGSFRSVRACADQVLAMDRALSVLVNNAGLAGRPPALTEDGFDETLGVNHLGHYLLTRLLVPSLLREPGARVVHVSSRAHLRAKTVRWDEIRSTRPDLKAMDRYGQSKLANVLFSMALARRYDAGQIASFALHPGVVATDIWRRIPAPLRAAAKLFMLSPEEGARASLFAATDASLVGKTGLYFGPKAQELPVNPVVGDLDEQERCWRESAKAVGLEP